MNIKARILRPLPHSLLARGLGEAGSRWIEFPIVLRRGARATHAEGGSTEVSQQDQYYRKGGFQ
jgi:hypothetical protein